MFAIVIGLLCLTLIVSLCVYMNVETKYYEKQRKIDRLYTFAKKNNLDHKALHELYEIALDKK